MILDKGQIIATRYEIIEKIGHGGMSIVYRAKDLRLGRFVTFKVLREEHLTDEEFVMRFRTEANAIASLSHRNIVNVYDVGVEDKINFIIMEYVKGVTLKDLIDKHAPFKEKEILGVSIQICEALQHAHSNGIIHRDIKPQNVLVTNDGAIKVMDFGIARTLNSDTIAVGGSTMGSVHYFSPEQARGSIVSFQSDLYSLGIVMYEMATGRLPFDAKEAVAVAMMHVNEPLPNPSAINNGLSESFLAMVKKLTEKKPQNRYQSAEALCSDLKQIMVNPNEKLNHKTLTAAETIQLTNTQVKKIKSGGKNGYANDGLLNNDDSLSTSGRQQTDEYDLDSEMEDEMIRTSGGGNKKQEILTIVAALVTFFVIITIALYFLLPIFKNTVEPKNEAYTTVPSFVGMLLDDGNLLAEEKNVELTVKREDASDEPEGTIIWQDYDEGGNVFEGTEIGVIVSKGPVMVTVPKFIGKKSDEAFSIADSVLNLTESFVQSDTVPKSIVISQSVEEGTLVKAGTEIVLEVSEGAEIINVTVPGITGKTEIEAKNLITEALLEVGTVSSDYSETVAEGKIISQNPPEGRTITSGSLIAYTVSAGPPPATITPTAVPSETPTETSQPTETSGEQPTTYPTHLTLSVNPSFPEGKTEINIILYKNTATEMIEVYNGNHTIEQMPLEIPVSGEGSVEFLLYVDGVSVGAKTVEFSSGQ